MIVEFTPAPWIVRAMRYGPGGGSKFKAPFVIPSVGVIGGIDNTYTPLGTLIVTLVVSLTASMTAARKVQVPAAVWHTPLPGLSSTASAGLFTLNVSTTCGAALVTCPVSSTTISTNPIPRAIDINQRVFMAHLPG